MSSLFIELYTDEDVSVLVAQLIGAKGFPATTARDCGQLGKEDFQQLEYAVSQQKAILTHNREDFEALALQYFEQGRRHYGIIIAVRRSSYEIADRLVDILNQVTADEVQNQLYYI